MESKKVKHIFDNQRKLESLEKKIDTLNEKIKFLEFLHTREINAYQEHKCQLHETKESKVVIEVD